MREGDATLAADYHRRVLDRVPEDDDALAALEGIYREAGDSEALYEILVRRAELARARHRGRARAAARRSARWPRPAGPPRRGDRRLRAGAGDSRRATARPRRRSIGCTRKAERWGDLTRLLEDLLERGVLPERDLVGIRFRMAQIEHDRQRRSRGGARTPARWCSTAIPITRARSRCWRGCSTTSRCRARPPSCWSRCTRARADWPALIKIGEIRLLQVEEPAAAAGLDQADRAPLRGAARGLRQRAALVRQGVPGGAHRAPEPGAAAAPGRQARIAGRTWPACWPATWRASWARSRRCWTSSAAPPRSSITGWDSAPEAREALPPPVRRAPRRSRGRAAVRGARWSAGAPGRSCASWSTSRPGARSTRRRSSRFLRRSAKLDEEQPGRPRARHRDAARGAGASSPATAAPPRSWNGCWRRRGSGTTWRDHLAGTPRSRRDGRSAGRGQRCAWRRSWRRGSDDAAARRRPLRRGAVSGTPGPPRGGRGARGAGRRRRPALPRRRHPGADLPAGAATCSKLVGRAGRRSSRRSTTAPSGCASCARWPRSISASARLDLAFDCRSRAWLADVESTETLAEMEALGARGAGCTAELVATLQKGAVEAGDPDLQAQLWAMRRGCSRIRWATPADAVEAWRVGAGGAPRRSGRLPGAGAAAVGGVARRPSWSRCWRSTSRSPPTPASARRWPSGSPCCTKTRSSSASRRCAPGRRCWGSTPTTARRWSRWRSCTSAGGAFRELAEIYARKIELTERPEERRMLRMQSARLYEEKLAEPEQAVEPAAQACWRRRRATPRRWTRWIASSPREGRHADLLEVLDLRGAAEKRDAARDELAFRGGAPDRDRARRRRGRRSGATSGILAAHARRTPATREALWAIARGDDYRLPAIAALEPVLRAAARLGRGHRAARAAPRGRGRGGAATGAAGRDRAHRGERAPRPRRARSRPGRARSTEERDRVRRRAQALERLAGRDRQLEAAGRRLRGAHGGDVRRRRCSARWRCGWPSCTRAARRSRRARREFLRKALSLPGRRGAGAGVLETVLRRLGRDTPSWPRSWRARPRWPAIRRSRRDFLAALGEVRLARARATRTGRWRPTATRSSATADHAGALRGAAELLDRAETREGALDVLEPLAAGARRLPAS